MSNGENKGTENGVDTTTRRTRTTTLETLRRANFDGKIPIKLVLAQTSLSSAVPPQPQHVLVSRQTFLHVGLEFSVRKLHEYALPTLSFLGNNNAKSVVTVVQEDDDDDDDDDDEKEDDKIAPKSSASKTTKKDESTENRNETDDKTESESGKSFPSNDDNSTPPYPVCWFEDVATGQPLRWQYFCGVLFDSLHCTTGVQNERLLLPWEIRLHFRSYPSQQLLEVCNNPSWGHNGGVLDTLRQTFRNSLKQAFVIRYGNSKEALNLSKQSHDSIWEGISTSHYPSIASVVHRDDEFVDDEDSKEPTNTTASSSTVTTAPAASKPNAEASETDVGGSDGKSSLATISEPDEKTSTEEDTACGATTTNSSITTTNDVSHKENSSKTNNLVMLPVRLSVDPTKPMVQKRCEGGTAAAAATLGSLLLEWVPSRFEETPPAVLLAAAASDTSNTRQQEATAEVRPKSKDVSWKIAGLSPPLSTPLLDLWLALRHPDNFLYIALSIPKQ